MSNRVILALDTSDLAQAMKWATATAPYVGGFKVGMELFYSCGRHGYEAIANVGRPVILDLKLKDIPRTVGKSVRSLSPLCPAAITVHADGGPQMIAEAVESAWCHSGSSTLILAV